MQIMFAVFLDLWSPASIVLSVPSHTFVIRIMSVVFLELWSSVPLVLSVPRWTFSLQFPFMVFLVLWLTVLYVLSVRSRPLLKHFFRCVTGVPAFCIISSVSIADSVCCISKIFLR